MRRGAALVSSEESADVSATFLSPRNPSDDSAQRKKDRDREREKRSRAEDVGGAREKGDASTYQEQLSASTRQQTREGISEKAGIPRGDGGKQRESSNPAGSARERRKDGKGERGVDMNGTRGDNGVGKGDETLVRGHEVGSDGWKPGTKWKKCERLGQGTFGIVFKALDVATRRFFAVKEISLEHAFDGDEERIRKHMDGKMHTLNAMPRVILGQR